MRDARRGISSRTPPVPSESHAEIDAWIRRRVMPDLQPIVRAVDASIRETNASVRYAIKWNRAYYEVPELGWIIEVAPYDVSVNVVFLGGADFDEPPPLGTTDRSRYTKVRTVDEALGAEMRRWIEQAQLVTGWR